MNRILAALLISFLVLSCTKIESKGPIVVETGYFTDRYYSGGNLIVADCIIGPFLEGESMVQIWIRNRVYDLEKRELILEVEMNSHMTTNNFMGELERLHRTARIVDTVRFVSSYRGLEITWNMFDEIYKTYFSYENYR